MFATLRELTPDPRADPGPHARTDPGPHDDATELVLLLFIKIEYTQAWAEVQFDHKLPEGCCWPVLRNQSGLNLLDAYR